MSHAKERGTVGSVEKMISIIELLDQQEGAQLSEIAAELNIAMSTAHRHVKTLEENGYVVSDGKQIRLSTEFLRLGNNVRYRSKLAEISEPLLEELASETGERANLFIEEHGRTVCIHCKLGDRGVMAETKIGKQFSMHATAAGKAMLAHFSRSEVRSIIQEHGLPAYTENTITERERLFEELRTIREQNIAYNDGEYIKNLGAIGVPILNTGDVCGAITISGPVHRLSDDRMERELKDTLLGTADELELELEYN